MFVGFARVFVCLFLFLHSHRNAVHTIRCVVFMWLFYFYYLLSFIKCAYNSFNQIAALLLLFCCLLLATCFALPYHVYGMFYSLSFTLLCWNYFSIINEQRYCGWIVSCKNLLKQIIALINKSFCIFFCNYGWKDGLEKLTFYSI